jgi:kinesin family protein 5
MAGCRGAAPAAAGQEEPPSYEFRFECAKLLLELDDTTDAAIQVLEDLLQVRSRAPGAAWLWRHACLASSWRALAGGSHAPPGPACHPCSNPCRCPRARRLQEDDDVLDTWHLLGLSYYSGHMYEDAAEIMAHGMKLMQKRGVGEEEEIASSFAELHSAVEEARALEARGGQRAGPCGGHAAPARL